MESTEKVKVSKNLIIFLCVFSLILVCLLGSTVYFYFNAPKEVIDEELNGGSINLTYTDDTNELIIENPVLMKDEDGAKQSSSDKYFDFTVNIDLDEANKVDYEISVVPSTKNTIPVKDIKVYIEKLKSGTFTSEDEPKSLSLLKKNTDIGTKKGSMVVFEDSSTKSGSFNYRLRAWIDSNSKYTVTDKDLIILKVEIAGKAS